MANVDDWMDVLLHIPNKFFIKETDLALCYKLWGGKFIAFPKRWVKAYTCDTNASREHTFTMPKWYIEKNSLRSLVDEQFKILFPLKREQKKKKDTLTPDMFDEKPLTATPIPTSDGRQAVNNWELAVDITD